MFGAARRGIVGIHTEEDYDLDADEFAKKSFEATELGEEVTSGRTKLTFDGDCGGLYLDENARAWCMHTTIHGVKTSGNEIIWISHGSVLQTVVNNHPFYFGHVPQSSRSMASLSTFSSETQASPRTWSITLADFVVPQNEARYPDLYIPPETEGQVIVDGYQRGVPHSHLPIDLPDDDDYDTSKI